jgi:hypothetical protein
MGSRQISCPTIKKAIGGKTTLQKNEDGGHRKEEHLESVLF